MSKFELDYFDLENTILKRSYKLDSVKDKIERVAFDVVRFKDDDKRANLWQIHNTQDGDYIIAMYENEEEKVADWQVNLNKISNDLQISYKNDPLVVLKANKLGIPTKDLSMVKDYLPQKLSSNKKLVKLLLNELSESAKKEVLSKYPELS